MKEPTARMLRYFLLLALTANLSGCLAVVAGGAAAGGYYVGKDERTVGEIADDAAITTKVKSLLLAEKTVKALSINVDTMYRVVTLNGQVRSKSEKAKAIEIARSVKGVDKVISNLEIKKVAVQDASA